MTTNRTPWGREITEARTDQRDTIVTPWGRTVQLTEDQKRERREREARAQEANRKAQEPTPKRTVEEAKPASRKVSIITSDPARVEKMTRAVREVWARQDVRAQIIREAAGRLS